MTNSLKACVAQKRRSLHASTLFRFSIWPCSSSWSSQGGGWIPRALIELIRALPLPTISARPFFLLSPFPLPQPHPRSLRTRWWFNRLPTVWCDASLWRTIESVYLDRFVARLDEWFDEWWNSGGASKWDFSPDWKPKSTKGVSTIYSIQWPFTYFNLRSITFETPHGNYNSSKKKPI